MDKIEIGKYYLDVEHDELLYVFGEGGMDITGSIECPYEVDIEDVINMIGIKVRPFISKDYLQFQNSMPIKTVYKDTREPVYTYSYNEWKNICPPKHIKERFEKSSYFMEMVKIFIEYMYKTYTDKYKDEIIRAREVFCD